MSPSLPCRKRWKRFASVRLLNDSDLFSVQGFFAHCFPWSSATEILKVYWFLGLLMLCRITLSGNSAPSQTTGF